ncbi:MAG: histidine--tRNA ligase [Syntrophomonadaceae bacterium]|jgi:histidyl-tRNA synthetase|nr:histidine--tRNA ligase [Syntrophomonadaceae bacterium]
MDIAGPRGTFDILPDASGKWQHVERVLREAAARAGYREVRTPIFEHTELFERGVGETTDIVQKEMYTFLDKGGRSLTLRPEGTASCVRAFIQHRVYAQPQPTKWYYAGPMFRYDRPQTGRFRQFHQFGAEVFGSRHPAVDAEMITLMVDMVTALGLTDYELHLNTVGCAKCRPGYVATLAAFLQPLRGQLCEDCARRVDANPLRVLDCKSRHCQALVQSFPPLRETVCEECARHFGRVQDMLAAYGVRFVLDDRLVRGLDYYTNTAFELQVPDIGAQSAVGGGGRYDGLVAACGGPDTPGIGFALGLERLLLAVEQRGLRFQGDDGLQVFVAAAGDDVEPQVASAVRELRQAGLRCDRDYLQRSLKAQMKHADRLGVRLVVIIGEEEVARGRYTVRDMRNQRQWELEPATMAAQVREILEK